MHVNPFKFSILFLMLLQTSTGFCATNVTKQAVLAELSRQSRGSRSE